MQASLNGNHTNVVCRLDFSMWNPHYDTIDCLISHSNSSNIYIKSKNSSVIIISQFINSEYENVHYTVTTLYQQTALSKTIQTRLNINLA